MAVTTAVLSGNVTDITGELTANYLRRVVIVIEANTDGSLLLDTDGNRIMAGPKRVAVDTSTGTYSVTLPKTDSDDILPDAPGRLYRVRLIYPSGIPGAGNISQISGWWELTADGSLSDADKWPGLEVTAVSDELLDSIAQNADAAEAAQAAAEAAQAAAEAVGATNDAIIAGRIADDASATTEELDARVGVIFTPERFGAVGDGVADDTTAVRNCFNAANALVRAGLTGTIKQPGSTVVLTGVYKLTSLAAPIDILCNVAPNRATFSIPDAYAGTAVRVGHTTSGSYFQAAEIFLPDIIKSTSASLVSGSIGCRVQNIGDSYIRFGRTAFFETGINLSGDGQGTAYNTFALGWISYCKVSLSLKPHTASGWCNHNTFIGGSIQQSPSYDAGDGTGTGTRRAGWRHVVIDGSAGQYVNGNNWFGTSFEGDVSEYWLYAKSAADNNFHGTRHEQGTLGTACTVSGDTITKTAHGLSVGDMVTFSASVAPTGMIVAAPYYVVTVPTADTFKVSFKKGGTAITFSSSGTSVTYFRPARAYFDLGGGGSILQNITIEKTMTNQGLMDIVKSTAGGSNLTFQRNGFNILDTYDPEDIPLVRARNSSGAAGLLRAVFAAYASTIDPREDPHGWSMALSDLGIIGKTNGVETGRIKFSSTGVIQFNLTGGATNYELATCIRSQTATTLASGTTYTAGTRTTGTATLTNASTGDYVAWTNSAGGAIPRGLVISARVSASNTITYDIDNNTAADITLAANITLFFKATRRFF